MRVAMLIRNDWRHDSRVTREAQALARLGHQVRVVCQRFADAPGVEHDEGVEFLVTPYQRQQTAAMRAALVSAHVQVVRLGIGLLFRRGTTRAGLRSLGPGFSTFARVGPGLMLDRLADSLRAAERRRVPAASFARKCFDRVHRWFSPLTARYLDSLRHLNEFAYTCSGPILDTRPRVVHANDLVTLSTAVLTARVLDCAVVYDAHEIETHTNYAGLSRATKRWIAFYERVLVHYTQTVITVSEGIADWLTDAYSLDERPVVVANAPAVIASTSRSDVRSDLGIGPEIPIVVYVGSVTSDRGLEETASALAELPGVQLVLIGPRHEPVEQAIRARAQRDGVEQRLHFIDPVPPRDVIGYIRSATCSVIPIQNACLSYYYCFPNKLLESVFARLPVAVSRLFELERFVERFGVGVVMDETSPAGIATGIGAAIRHRSELTPTDEALARIANEFGWPAQEARLARVYDRLRGLGAQAASPAPPALEATRV